MKHQLYIIILILSFALCFMMLFSCTKKSPTNKYEMQCFLFTGFEYAPLPLQYSIQLRRIINISLADSVSAQTYCSNIIPNLELPQCVVVVSNIDTLISNAVFGFFSPKYIVSAKLKLAFADELLYSDIVTYYVTSGMQRVYRAVCSQDSNAIKMVETAIELGWIDADDYPHYPCTRLTNWFDIYYSASVWDISNLCYSTKGLSGRAE